MSEIERTKTEMLSGEAVVTNSDLEKPGEMKEKNAHLKTVTMVLMIVFSAASVTSMMLNKNRASSL